MAAEVYGLEQESDRRMGDEFEQVDGAGVFEMLTLASNSSTRQGFPYPKRKSCLITPKRLNP